MSWTFSREKVGGVSCWVMACRWWPGRAGRPGWLRWMVSLSGAVIRRTDGRTSSSGGAALLAATSPVNERLTRWLSVGDWSTFAFIDRGVVESWPSSSLLHPIIVHHSSVSHCYCWTLLDACRGQAVVVDAKKDVVSSCCTPRWISGASSYLDRIISRPPKCRFSVRWKTSFGVPPLKSPEDHCHLLSR